MTSGQDVSEYLDTLGLVRSYFSIFLRKKKENVLVLRCSDAPEDQAICLFAGLLANPDMPLSPQELQRAGFHQLLSLNKNTRADCWGNKIKGWWRRGDIKATKFKKTRECWVKSLVNAPSETAKDITEALITPGQNYGKDSYTIDLTGSETTY